VTDNGPGIPEASRERIFPPFFTTRSRGTGLGLAIVQKVVVMHNGRVIVQQPPAGGASVQLAFPLAGV
jgi:signal transduction histidine kinase